MSKVLAYYQDAPPDGKLSAVPVNLFAEVGGRRVKVSVVIVPRKLASRWQPRLTVVVSDVTDEPSGWQLAAALYDALQFECTHGDPECTCIADHVAPAIAAYEATLPEGTE